MALVTVCVDGVALDADSALTAPPMASERIIQAAARATRRRFGRLGAGAVTMVGFIGLGISK